MIRALRDHAPENPDALAVRAGDRLHVGHADDANPGWRWCTTADGRAGWVPETSLPRLRQGGGGDAGTVAALHIASWQATYRGELPDRFLDNQSLAERTAEWERRLAGPSIRLLLIEGAGMLLGFTAYGPSRDADADPAAVWELYNLHLMPEQRGGGLGQLLFAGVAEDGRRAGRARLSLWVGERNWPARRFYERRGMHPDGATQMHRLGPDAELAEVRYVRALD